MKVKSIKDASKKNAVKTAAVTDIKAFAKKKEVYSGKMMLRDVRAIAEKMGLDAEDLDKAGLIRAIQKAEGFNDCYSSVQAKVCDQTNCLWREDCASC